MTQLIFNLGTAPDTSAGSYLPLASHAEALAHIQRMNETAGFAGLILQGATNTGKTHLLHAWQGTVLAEKDFPPSETCTHFAADDIDTAGTEGQEALFHTFNQLKNNGGKLLITATHAITPEMNILKDLRSRLLTLPVAVLAAPTEADAMQLLLKWAQDKQMELPQNLINYLLIHTERSPTHLKRIIERLNTLSLTKQQKPTLPLVKEILEELAC